MFKLVALLSCLTISSAAYAKEKPEDILLGLPSAIHGFESLEIKSYEQAMLGSSLGYNYRGEDGEICATLYVYDMGLPQIPDGIESDEVRTAYKFSKRDIDYYEEKGVYEDVALSSEGSHTTKVSEDVDFLSLRAEYQYLNNKETCGKYVTSYIYLSGARNHFVKVRATVKQMTPNSLSRIESLVDYIILELTR